MNKSIKWFVCLGFICTSMVSHAVKINSKIIKRHAYLTADENNSELYTPLDLRAKKYTFTLTDGQICGKLLVREEDSLSYSCTLELPKSSSQSKLHEQKSPRSLKVKWGKQIKNVQIQVSEDAKYATFSTEFDITGMDFETLGFNEEFFKLYNKNAQSVFTEAMRLTPLKIEVLEN